MSNNVMLGVLATVLLSCATSSLAADQVDINKADLREPIPDKVKLAKVTKLIKDIFKEEYARRDAASKVALVTKLLEQASKEKDATSRYALLREARMIAEQAGDPDLALKVVQATAKDYRIDASKEKLQSLQICVRNMRSNVQAKAIAIEYLKVYDSAILANDFHLAKRAVLAIEGIARSTKNLPLFNRARRKTTEIRELKSAFERVQKAMSLLKAKADDPFANTAVGKYLCFIKGDWANGLPKLALCSDPILKEIAIRELSGIKDAALLSELGESWWKIMQKSKSREAEQIMNHATRIFIKAETGLSGLARAKVLTRIQSIVNTQHNKLNDLTSSSPVIGIFDGKTLNGWQVDDHWEIREGAIFCPTGKQTYSLTLAQPIPMPFEVWMEIQLLRLRANDGKGFKISSKDGRWSLIAFDDLINNAVSFYGAAKGYGKVKCETGRWYKVRCRVRRDRITVDIDGKELLNSAWSNSPPYRFSLICQRSGAMYRNLVILTLE